MDLFGNEDIVNNKKKREASKPLAERLRPESLDDFFGQSHLIGEGKPIRTMLGKGELVSMIFWGPPGVGKTTLALIIANAIKSDFMQLSAVSAGVKDVRTAIEKAEFNLERTGKRTILFIDEIHRFNKSQQDSLLHSVEQGIITLIGATTENPSFEVISPLLSRCRVYVLEELSVDDLSRIIDQALERDEMLNKLDITVEDKDSLIGLSGGDARKLLNGLDLAVKLSTPDENGKITINTDKIKEAFQAKYIRYDKDREEHYNIISAFIKSIRGSDPDAALYWMSRMLKGGEDPKFIARRMIILASEDIGNADPYALTLATNCFTAITYIGMPEGQLVLAQTATYLASCEKSNASYKAIKAANDDVENKPTYGVPLHLRNAPTKLMKELDYGKDYKYAHDFENNFAEQNYLPEELKDAIYYEPKDSGREAKFKERLKKLWEKRK